MKLPMVNIIGWGVAIAIAISGNLFAQSRTVDAKIEAAKAETYQANVQIVQRVSSLEEAVGTIKDDNKTIKADIKEILRLLK